MPNTAFDHSRGDLLCEAVRLSDIAQEFGTPCYVYSHARIVENYRAFSSALASRPHLIAYAAKANSNKAILRILAREGAGVDAVSGGEMARAREAGIPSERIVFTGVGKRGDEIERALRDGILLLNVESIAEMEQVGRIARALSVCARIGIRVNPEILVHTHPHVATGGRGDKFGLPVAQALLAYRRARAERALDPAGIHMHIGSQITNLSSYRDGLRILCDLVRTLVGEGIDLRFFDLGGGLGISYLGEPAPGPAALAATVLPLLDEHEGRIIVEPGRSIVGDSAVLLTTVLYQKPSSPRSFLIVDAAMNDLIRPSLYGARHRVLPVVHREEAEQPVDIVGPICESADTLARDCLLPSVEPGEYLAIKDVGAYGFSMASHYNSRPLPAEVLVRGSDAFLIRERETVGDLTRSERIPCFLT